MSIEDALPSIAERLRASVSLKMAVIGFLTLVLLIPVAMLDGLVSERTALRASAAADIMRGWGGPQLVAGPVLMFPARVVSHDANSRRVTNTRLNVLPQVLDIDAALEPEMLYRGIHEVPVYRAALQIRGSLRMPEAAAAGPSLDELFRGDAFVAVALSDAGATRSAPVLRIAGREIPFEAAGVLQRGWPPHMIARIGDIAAAAAPGTEFDFEILLDFAGGESLHILPLGDRTNVAMHSAWPSPSFAGRYLPHEREVGDSGFLATWQLSGLARSLPSVWLDGTTDAAIDTDAAVGVTMYSPVDLYQKTLRATKYALLFVGLTFVACFLFETMGRLELHPMQYLLIGFANVLFYLLLLSLAEHAGFGIAYLLSAAASTLLVAGYSRSVLMNARRAGMMAALLAGLYGFLYLVLQAEDYALLAGAVGLWLILGTVMYLTRHVDWYRARGPGVTR